jgi:hypothetical protein
MGIGTGGGGSPDFGGTGGIGFSGRKNELLSFRHLLNHNEEEFRGIIESAIEATLEDFPSYKAMIGFWYIVVEESPGIRALDLRKIPFLGWVGFEPPGSEFLRRVYTNPAYTLPHRVGPDDDLYAIIESQNIADEFNRAFRIPFFSLSDRYIH